MRTRALYTPCRLYIDGLPQLAVGDYIVTEAGSAYLVQTIRPSPTKPQRRYLGCLRWALAEIPTWATRYVLTWYRRQRRVRRLKDLQHA